MASQGQSTPIKMGSPLRNKTAAVTPAPLIHSVKAKRGSRSLTVLTQQHVRLRRRGSRLSRTRST